MRRPMTFILAGIIVALLGTAGMLFQLYRKAVVVARESERSEADARVEYERALGAITTIRDSVAAVAADNASMEFRNEGPEPTSRTVEQRTRETLARVAALESRIKHNKALITQLEAESQKGGVRTAEQAKTIAALRKSVAREEQLVARLTERERVMTARVTELESEVRQNNETIRAREETIERKRRELATVYYVVGTKKELATNGITVASGGVLGLGRSLRVSGHLNDSLFIPLDTDRDNAIRISASNAVVLSAQDTASYALKPDGGHLTLEIRDPYLFRRVKYVVISTQ